MNNNTKKLVLSALFLAIAIVFQFIGQSLPGISQVFVGPIVNAVLLISAAVCGIWWGTVVGMLTPLLAWTLGQLPRPFGPFIPFIMIGNAIFVIVFYMLRKHNKTGEIAGVVLGGFLKFIFLYLSATKLIKVLHLGIPIKVINKLGTAMGIIQFITALVGGALAILIISLLKKRRQI